MVITDVRVRLLRQPKNNTYATAAITFDDSLVIHDIQVQERPGGLSLAMPNRRCGDGAFRDIVHPANRGMRAQIVDAVSKAYFQAQDDAVRAALVRENSRYLS